MNKSIFMYSCLLLLSVFIGSVSQLMLKKASLRKYSSTIKEYINPLVISAYILFFVTTLLSVFAYRVVPLSLGPALEATSYVYITFFGVVIFKEKLNKNNFFALILIISGILVYSFL